MKAPKAQGENNRGKKESVYIETLFTTLTLLFSLLLWMHSKLNPENVLCQTITSCWTLHPGTRAAKLPPNLQPGAM